MVAEVATPDVDEARNWNESVPDVFAATLMRRKPSFGPVSTVDFDGLLTTS